MAPSFIRRFSATVVAITVSSAVAAVAAVCYGNTTQNQLKYTFTIIQKILFSLLPLKKAS